jgi:hypothetical protein
MGKLLSLSSLEGNKKVIVVWQVVCSEEVLLFFSFETVPYILLVSMV